jgi:HEAT repeat protein
MQAERAENPVDRFRALEHLGTVDDSARVIPVIIGRARTDSSPGVRREAVQMLGMMSGGSEPSRDDVKRALLDAVKDPVPSVRTSAVPFLTDSGDTETIATLHHLLRDSSYVMVARALRALSKADPARAESTLVQYLDVPSHRDVIASTALSALGDAAPVHALSEALKRVKYGYPQPTRTTAITLLRRQAAKGKGTASTFLPLVTDRNIWLRTSALNALGDCATEQDLPLLDGIAADEHNPVARAAAKAAFKTRARLKNKG